VWLLRALRIVAILTPLVPAALGYSLSNFVGFVFFICNFRARRNIVANLRQVDPGMHWLTREKTALRVCQTVITNYYDLLRLRSVDRDNLRDRVEVHGLEHVERALKTGCGAIIVSAHIGNFSVMARLPATLGIHAALIAERVEPPELYHYMARLRSAMGIEVIPPEAGSIRRILHVLSDNGVLLLAADRDVTRHGKDIRFFGKQTKIPVGPIMLAMKTQAPIIPAFTVRDSRQRSRVIIEPPLKLRTTSDWEYDVHINMEQLARRLERMIAFDPGQWAVLQRVWPPTSVYGRSEGLGSADESIQVNEMQQEGEGRKPQSA
jgi:phosphatidylinositol dimannoside acyltransferase